MQQVIRTTEPEAHDKRVLGSRPQVRVDGNNPHAGIASNLNRAINHMER